MTTTTIPCPNYPTYTPRRRRPQGLYRVLIKANLAMIVWARHRSDRDMLTHEEHALRRANRLVVERNSWESQRRAMRIL